MEIRLCEVKPIDDDDKLIFTLLTTNTGTVVRNLYPTFHNVYHVSTLYLAYHILLFDTYIIFF